MKNIVVLSLKKAGEELSSPHSAGAYDRVLSIGDPGSKLPPGLNRVKQKLRLEFDDLDINLGAILLKKKNIPPVVLPALEHAQKIIENSEMLLSGEGTLIVHCYAGISRSTAAAYILAAIDRGPGKELEAIDYVESVTRSRSFDPNPLLVQYADEILKGEFELKASLDYWIKQNQRYFG